ncbi:MAG: hypothetical protein JSV56_10720, partial [Methanomassiliicoccales archaeon]
EREVSMGEFQYIGSEIVDMERSFNNKRDFDAKDDILPKRVNVPNMEKELQVYYDLRGWTKDGRVGKKK